MRIENSADAWLTCVRNYGVCQSDALSRYGCVVRRWNGEDCCSDCVHRHLTVVHHHHVIPRRANHHVPRRHARHHEPKRGRG
jgi:hypothetical protein